jgi:UDP-3-O-[3-hydroxymyristoyl] N-acetylglucosamine deacetylase
VTTRVFSPPKREFLANPAHLEQTIIAPLEFAGVGLHSGAPVTMRLLPAPAGSGIVFRRTDLDNFEIPATGRYVAKVSYATSLMRQGVLIQTTEHLLSSLIGMGIDNVIAELDNLELPILDGSALPYVEAFQRVGIRTQRRRRETIRVISPIEVREGNKFIGLYPGPGYSIEYSIDFPAPVGHQTACIDLAAETYGQLIAPARTFGYKVDEQKLRDMGLIRGAGPESIIILGAKAPGAASRATLWPSAPAMPCTRRWFRVSSRTAPHGRWPMCRWRQVRPRRARQPKRQSSKAQP